MSVSAVELQKVQVSGGWQAKNAGPGVSVT